MNKLTRVLAVKGTKIKSSTVDKYYLAKEFDDNDYTGDKIVQVLEGKGYGYTGDDGFSNSLHEIKAVTYYYSSSLGDDSNDGLSPITPKKTLRDARIRTGNYMNDGDGIAFKRGDVWSAEDGEVFDSLYYNINAGNVEKRVMTCYGNGPLPVFDGWAEQLPSMIWTDNGDGTWYCDNVIYGSVAVKSIKIDGVYARSSFSLAELLTDNDALYFHDVSALKLYVKQDPTTLSSVQYSSVEGTILPSSSGSEKLYYSHLHIKNARVAAITSFSTGITIHSCILGEQCNFGISLGARDVLVYNNLVDSMEPQYGALASRTGTYPNGGFEGIRVYTKDDQTDVNVKVHHNTIKNFRHASIAFNGNGDSLIPCENMHAYKNIFYMDPNIMDYGCRFAYQYVVNKSSFRDNCLINAGSTQITGTDNTMTDNLFYKTMNSLSKTYNTGTAVALNVTDSSGINNFLLDNNVMYKADGNASRISTSNVGPITNHTISNNIMVENGRLECVYPTGFLKGTQYYHKSDDRTYMSVNAVIRGNLMFSTEPRCIAIGPEGDLTGSGAFYTVSDAEAYQFTDGTVMEGNLQFDPGLDKYND